MTPISNHRSEKLRYLSLSLTSSWQLIRVRFVALIILGSILLFFVGHGWAEDLSNLSNDKVPSLINIDSLKVLDLHMAIQLALAKNPTLAAAQDRVEQARAGVRRAKASYWPLLDVSGSVMRLDIAENSFQQSFGSANTAVPVAAATGPESYYSSSLTASWLLFDGFSRKFSNLAARYAEQESIQAKSDSKRLLVSAVALAFYSAQLSRENIAIAQADMSFNQEEMDDAMARRRVGTGSLSDVLNFAIQVNGAKTALLTAKQRYGVTMSALAALLGLESAFPAALDVAVLHKETLAEMVLPDIEILTQTALNNRPDIIATKLMAERLVANENAAQAAFYPTINLVAALDGNRTDDVNFSSDDFGNSLVLSLSYNIFDGGAKRAKISEAHAKKRAATKEVSALLLQVRSEVREALIRLRVSQKQLRLQRDNSELVQQNRDLVQKEFAAGQASLVRLNEAQRDLTRVTGKLALAIVLVRQSWQNMAVVTGLENPANVMALVPK